MSEQNKTIVIIGGGIIGSTTAYFLSRHPAFDRARHRIVLLEATKIAGGASGKAGGLLALWAYPKCIVPLSYRLHAELAERHGGAERWGYRSVHCGQLDAHGLDVGSKAAAASLEQSVSLGKRGGDEMALLRRKAGLPDDLDWVAPDRVDAYEEMGDPTTTAQVHPHQFTTSMAALAEEAGVEIIYGSVTSIDIAPSSANAGGVRSVTYSARDSGESKLLPADQVVLSAGPWTQAVYPPAPIAAVRAHSVTIRPVRPVSAYALFTSISLRKSGNGKSMPRHVSPEIYARPNNEVYACGEGDHVVSLPATTDLVDVDAARCQDIVQSVGSISDELRDGAVTARQACYLPNVRGATGGPLIGNTSVTGLLIAAGHTCWGIQNAPATGKCIAEIVWEGKAKSANLSSLDPRKVM